jgi:N-acylneuraminate cytidylyltransferase
MTEGIDHVVAIIPARGGSTRVPRKNLAPLGGHPLIAHTILAARGASELTNVYVSTEDPEIADVAVSYGASVIWRPAELALATSPTEPALKHAVDTIERTGPAVDALVMLQATSPFRGPERIDQAIQLWRETRCDSVVAVVPDVRYYFLGDVDHEGRLRVGYDPQNRLRTQDIPPRYQETGSLYLTARRHLMEHGCRMGGKMRALILDETEAMDIDTILDLRHCEFMLETGLAQALPALRRAA